jgi:hypothetical protein
VTSRFGLPPRRLPCGAYSIGVRRRFCTGFRRALPELVAAACQVGGLGGVARYLDGFVVRRARLLSAAQPAQQVGAGRMVGVIAGQLVLETVDGRQRHFRAVKLGDRDGPVEGDDRRGVEVDELVVEGDDLRPVGGAYVPAVSFGRYWTALILLGIKRSLRGLMAQRRLSCSRGPADR